MGRPRLFARLDQATACALTLISAPAGSGKSTLISSWVHSSAGRRFAWLELDADENDLSRFICYLILALQPIQPGIGKAALSLLGSLQTPPPEVVITGLLNEIGDLPEPVVLVLDDFHTIKDSQVDAALAYAVEHMPQQLRLVVATRKEPALPLSRWRALGLIAEIDAEDLRFSDMESAIFLENTMKIALDAESALALASKTDGWVAGLQLAALSLKGHVRVEGQDCIRQYVNKFNGEHLYIKEYLDEIYLQQPEDIRIFLARTAVLNRLTPSLCAAVTGCTNAQSKLIYLERNNLFLIRLDDNREWYRYHPLFLEYLRAAIVSTEERELHLKAKVWYEENGLALEALKHALAAQDMPEALRLLRILIEVLCCRGEFTTILSLLESFPNAIVLENGDLSGFKAWILYLSGRNKEAEAYATLALGSQTAKTPPSLHGTLLAFQAFLAINRGAPKKAVPLAREALACFGDVPSFFRVCALSLLGHAQRQLGDQVAARESLRQAVKQGLELGNELTTLDALGAMATLMYAQGHLREAMQLCNSAIQRHVDARGKPLPVAGLAYIPRGILHYETDNLKAAQEDLVTGIALCRQLSMVYFTLLGQRALARVYFTSGDREAAWNTLAVARRLAVESENPRRAHLVDAVTAELNLRDSNFAAAKRALAEIRGGNEVPSEYERLIYARLLVAESELRKAESILAQLERAAVQAQRLGTLIAIQLQQALCKSAQGDRTGALERMGRAVSLAAPENYRRTFIDLGPMVGTLLSQLRGVAPKFVASLLPSFGQTNAAGPQPDLTFDQRLTSTQVRILSLLSDGKTNQEIADSLAITVGTVKWHMHQIFGKLEVRNRTEAVALARRAGILG